MDTAATAVLSELDSVLTLTEDRKTALKAANGAPHTKMRPRAAILFTNTFYGLFDTWICELNPKCLGEAFDLVCRVQKSSLQKHLFDSFTFEYISRDYFIHYYFGLSCTFCIMSLLIHLHMTPSTCS